MNRDVRKQIVLFIKKNPSIEYEFNDAVDTDSSFNYGASEIIEWAYDMWDSFKDSNDALGHKVKGWKPLKKG